MSDRMGEASVASEVPVELRGREASARMLTPLFEAGRRKGVTPGVLAAGASYPVALLLDPNERVPWSAFMTVLGNLGRVLTDDELIALGETLVDTPTARTLMLPGRLLLSLPDVYRWVARADSPLVRLLAAHENTFTQLSPRTIRVDVRIKPGYAVPREFWLTRLGFLRSIPRVFGLPPAKVTFTSSDTSSSYEILLPPQSTLVNRLKKRVSWLLAARETAAELQRAHDDLHDRFLELRREMEARRLAEERLRLMNAELEERVRARTQDLEEANRKLAATNAELTLFSASVAHDLRAPLRAINSFATALVQDHGAQLDDDAKRELGRVSTNAIRMGLLIDSLLALSRITRVEMKHERIDVSLLARTVVADLRLSDPERRVQLAIDDGMSVEGDLALVRALLEHLLGNAWKFTRHRPIAHIAFTCADGEFCIRDDGAGFDMQHIGAIFAPFHRLHSEKEYEGMGIGLAIADRIVRRHGGTIGVQATPGEGAAFSFTLAPR